MNSPDTSPATKEDVRLIMESIFSSEKKMLHEFKVAVETIQHDLKGANKDEIQSIKNRITRVERHVGLTPA